MAETTLADWDLQHDVLARGSFLVSREAARLMRDQAVGGDIIYICSKNAVFAGPANIAYGAAKADQAHHGQPPQAGSADLAQRRRPADLGLLSRNLVLLLG